MNEKDTNKINLTKTKENADTNEKDADKSSIVETKDTVTKTEEAVNVKFCSEANVRITGNGLRVTCSKTKTSLQAIYYFPCLITFIKQRINRRTVYYG